MEPERPIEKLLRAAAKKRREQAGDPLELHPVAREELLREVSRRSEQKSGGNFFSNLFSAFRPRLALAFGVLAILVVAGFWIVPQLTEKPESASLAQLDYQTLSGDRSKAMPSVAAHSTPAPATPQPTHSAATPAPAPPTEAAANRQLAIVPPSLPQSDGEVVSRAQEENEKPLTAESPPPAMLPEGSARRNGLPMAKNALIARPVPGPMIQGQSMNPTPPGTGPTFAAAPPAGFQTGANADKQIATGGISALAASSIVTNAIAPSVTVAAAEPDVLKSLDNQFAAFDSAAKDRANTPLTPVSQHFYRVTVAPPATKQSGFGGGGGAFAGGGAGTSLLSSFQVVQNGPVIRILDADGSVYTGSWQSTPFEKTPASDAFKTIPANTRANAGPQTQAEPASGHAESDSLAAPPAASANARIAAPALPTYYFSVTGTNRNLNQKIVFSGTFIPLPNGSNARPVVGGIAGARAALPAATSPPVLLNSRISGKAIIGDRREIEVNATPAP